VKCHSPNGEHDFTDIADQPIDCCYYCEESNPDYADEDNAPITRGEMRALIKKLRSRIWHEYTYETPEHQVATNNIFEGFAEDLEAVLGEP
jgi:hypothetical protein